jgi:hypothetical protein
LGLRDVLLGRKKLKDAAGERLFAISTARITLETELGLKSAGSAGVCFKALSAGDFVRTENELQELLDSVAAESGSKVTSVHLVASELAARGFGGQLLAAVFPFENRGFDEKRVYWIYGFKRGAFWPFVPKGEGKERDNAEELELKAKLEQELPVEQDLSRWFGIFDAPL